MQIRLMIKPIALWAIVATWHCTASVAQESMPTKEAPQATGSSTGVFDLLEQMVSPMSADTGAPQGRNESRDPTSPPPSLLERVPLPAPDQPALPPTRSSRPNQPAALVPLPSLPQIALRGLVMSTPDRGTAMLDVDGNPVTITLLPREQQQRMPIPEIQFADMKIALDQRAALASNGTNRPKPGLESGSQYEMCLQCSFIANGIVFNLEAFSSEALLLRAVPHDSIVLVRKAH